MKIISLSKLKEKPVSHNPKVNKKVMIKKGEIPHLENFSQAYFKPGNIASEHIHEDLYEVFLIEKGAGILKVDGKVNQIKKGDCLIIEPGDSHEFLNIGSENLVFTYFRMEK